MDFDHMPEDVIRLILDLFDYAKKRTNLLKMSTGSAAESSSMSMFSLVQKSFVCTRWMKVVRTMLRNRQHSLKLFDSPHNITLYRYYLAEYGLLDEEDKLPLFSRGLQDHLFVRDFTDETMDRIILVLQSLFYDVTNVVIFSLNLDHGLMLTNWPGLTTLTIIELPYSHKLQDSFWESLNNSLLSLRALHLFSMQTCKMISDNMPVIARLEKFTLDLYSSDPIPVLKQLSSNCRQLRIGPYSAFTALSILKQLTTCNFNLVSNLTHFSIRSKDNLSFDQFCTVEIVKMIGEKFRSLTFLDLEFIDMVMLPILHSRSNAFSVDRFHLTQACHLSYLKQFSYATLIWLSLCKFASQAWHVFQSSLLFVYDPVWHFLFFSICQLCRQCANWFSPIIMMIIFLTDPS